MADKPIYSLDVETDQFDEFKANFDAYAATLKGTLDDWKAVAKEIKGASGDIKGIAEAMKQGRRAANGGSGSANDNRSPNNNNRPPPPPKTDPAMLNAMRTMGGDMRTVASELKKMGTTMLRQVGSYAGGATQGVIGGVEGILGGLQKSGLVQAVVTMAAAAVTAPMLAAFYAAPDVANMRKQAQSISPNMNTADVRAARAAASWAAVDPMVVLKNLGIASTNRFSDQSVGLNRLYGNRSNVDQELKKDPGTQLFDLLDKIEENLKGVDPDKVGNVLQRLGTARNVPDELAKQWHNMSPDQRALRRAEFAQTRAATYDPENGKAFTDFYAKMKNAGEMMESSFTQKLKPLLGPLGDWVDKLTDAIGKDNGVFAGWVQTLADTLKDHPPEEIMKWLDEVPWAQFGKDIAAVASAMATLAKNVAWLIHPTEETAGAAPKGAYADPETGKGILLPEAKPYDWKGGMFGVREKPNPNLVAPKQYGPTMEEFQRGKADREKGGWNWRHPFGKHAEADTFKPYRVAGLNWEPPPDHPVRHVKPHMGISERIGSWFKGGEELKPRSISDMNFGGLAAKYAPPWARGVYNTLAPTPADSGELPLGLSGARPEHPHSTGMMPAAPSVLDQVQLTESRKQTELLTDIKTSLDKATAVDGAHGGQGGGGGGGGNGPGDGTGAGEAPSGSGAYLAGRFGRGGGGAPAGVRMRSGGGGGGAGPSMSGGSGGGYSGGKVKSSKEAQATAAMVADKFRAAGASDEGIAGMMKNVQDEGGFGNAGSRHFDQPRFRGTEAENAHGLWQMGGTEWNEYDKWMKKNRPGGDWKDPKNQTDWQIQNLQTRYPKLWAKMKTHAPAGEQAGDFTQFYERPSKENLDRRRAEAARGVPGIEAYTGGKSAGDTAIATTNAGKAAGAASGGAGSAFFDERKGKGVSGTSGGLNAEFAGRLENAVKDAEKATGEKAKFTSLTRSRATQEKLYYNYTHGIGGQGLAAKPGTSFHELGFATDLAPGKTRDYIMAHADKYGLHGLGAKDPEHIELARNIIAQQKLAGNTRLADAEAQRNAAVAAATPSPKGKAAAAGAPQHQASLSQNSQPMGLHNWQLAPKAQIALNNKTGSDVHLSSGTMAA